MALQVLSFVLLSAVASCVSVDFNTSLLCPSTEPCVSKCCATGEVIDPGSGQCTETTTLDIISEINTNQCPFRVVIGGSFEYLQNGSLLLNGNNQILRTADYCVERVDSSLLPFKCVACDHSTSKILEETPTNHSDGSIETINGYVYPSPYWWVDVYSHTIRVCSFTKSLPIRKCCREDYIVADEYGLCTRGLPDPINTPTFLELDTSESCPLGRKLSDLNKYDKLAFIKNGTLLLPKHGKQHVSTPEFCMDWVKSLESYRTFYCLACDEKGSEVMDGPVDVDEGGRLSTNDTVYNADEWWKDASSNIRVCDCFHLPCIYKCCSGNEYMDLESSSCVEGSAKHNNTHLGNYKLIHKNPCATGEFVFQSAAVVEGHDQQFRSDGSLELPELERLTLHKAEYCVERTKDGGKFYAFPCYREDYDYGTGSTVVQQMLQPCLLTAVLAYTVLRNTPVLNLIF